MSKSYRRLRMYSWFTATAAAILGLFIWAWGAIGIGGSPKLANLPSIATVVWERDAIFHSTLEGTALRKEGVVWEPGQSRILDVRAGDESFAVLVDDENDAPTAMILDRNGKEQSPRFSLPGGTTVALSSDGKKLAYVSCTNSDCGLGVLRLGDRTRSILVSGGVGQDKAISWRPDGKAIAYTTDGGEVAIYGLSQNRVRILIRGFSPSYSPDGERLALARDDLVIIADANTGKVLHSARKALAMRCDERSKTILGPLCVFDRWLLEDTRIYWGPDGKYLLFSDEDVKQPDLMNCWILEPATGAVARISEIWNEAWGWCGPWLDEKS